MKRSAWLLLTAICLAAVAQAGANGWRDFVLYDFPSKRWALDGRTDCYVSGIREYDQLVAGFAKAVLGRSDSEVGCVTYPYLQAPYDDDGAMGIRNLAHAGIDLRARDVPVFAAHEGTVEYVNLCVPGPGAGQPLCTRRNPGDVSEVHSTLVIEDPTRSYKTLYLHMKSFEPDIKAGAQVRRGQRLGMSGDIGAKGGPHLHIEVRPNWSRGYCEAVTAVSGAVCSQDTARPMKDGPQSVARPRRDYCTRDDLMSLTVDPVIVFHRLAEASGNITPRLTTASPVFLTRVGPIRIGMTLAEAEKALGAPMDAEYAGAGDRMACGYATPRYGPAGIGFMLTQGRVARIDIDACRFATRSGVRIGDSEAKVKAVYPDVSISEHKYDPEGRYLMLAGKDTDAGFALVFETHRGRVTRFRVGKTPEVYWVEGCL